MLAKYTTDQALILRLWPFERLHLVRSHSSILLEPTLKSLLNDGNFPDCVNPLHTLTQKDLELT